MNVSIVIPAHNEQDNLPKLLDNLLGLKALKDFEIIVVNDNSSDNTSKVAAKFASKHKNVYAMQRKKGINGMGAALKYGTKFARGNYIIWVMGDNSDDLSVIPKFIVKLNEGYDIVFGSRYMEGGSRGDLEIFKAIAGSGYTLAARVLFGIKAHDITNAFRAFKKEMFNDLTLDSNNFAISPEFAIKAQLKGYKMAEVPTIYKNRRAGQTKFKFLKMGVEYCKLLKYRFIR